MAFYHLISEPQMNFTLNRLLAQGEETVHFEEVETISKKINDFDTWYTEWKKLAVLVEREKRYFHAAFYYRLAEFFLRDDSPEKMNMYRKSMENFGKAFEGEDMERFSIPYRGSWLPAIRTTAHPQKAVVLVHGGYDSFMEEFYPFIRNHFVSRGYSVILFEGPGQGQARKNGLTFTEQWEKPVKAVLDYFKIKEAVLVGISWGGFLAPRAAAFEPRVKQVVSYDVFYDGLEFITNQMPGAVGRIMRGLVRMNAGWIVNQLINRARRKKRLLDWAVDHGMYITGTDSPFYFLKSLSRHRLEDVAHLIKQDVLLLAGQDDHLVPSDHFCRMIRSLTNVRSLTARLFTRAEGGEQHCQVGNIGLARDEMLNWLDRFYP